MLDTTIIEKIAFLLPRKKIRSLLGASLLLLATTSCSKIGTQLGMERGKNVSKAEEGKKPGTESAKIGPSEAQALLQRVSKYPEVFNKLRTQTEKEMGKAYVYIADKIEKALLKELEVDLEQQLDSEGNKLSLIREWLTALNQQGIALEARRALLIILHRHTKAYISEQQAKRKAQLQALYRRRFPTRRRGNRSTRTFHADPRESNGIKMKLVERQKERFAKEEKEEQRLVKAIKDALGE